MVRQSRKIHDCRALIVRRFPVVLSKHEIPRLGFSWQNFLIFRFPQTIQKCAVNSRLDRIAREKMQLYLPNVFYWERTWTWQASVQNIKKNEEFLRQTYRKHISHVKSVVPADRLLVW